MEGEHIRVQAGGSEQVLVATVDALAGTLGLRDGGTGKHSGRVSDMARRVGRRHRLRPASLRDLVFAAEIHDIGKVGVPDAVLLKAGPLSPAERQVMDKHPELLVRFLFIFFF